MNLSGKHIIIDISVFIIVFFITTNTLGQEQKRKTIEVRVLTYNILHGATLKNDFDLYKIAKVIDSLKPDIVALQEVDFKTNRAKKLDLMTELAHLTGLSPLFGRAMYYDDGEYGEGILSDFSFIQTRRNLLPYSEGHEPRAALEVLIELATGDTVRFVGSHLDHTKDPGDRIDQCAEINRLFAKNDYPSILAGDLNAEPDSKEINLLKTIWNDAAGKNVEKTYPSDNPKIRIDYIMFKSANKWKVLEYKIIQDKVASDHCAVFAVLELQLR
ncbi:MAG: endonuclease/exonuclease/phosphatase family protein [Bacteroidota bacterium]